MTKAELKQYRFCKKRISEIDEEIDRILKENTVHDTVKGSQKEFPYILRTSSIDGCPEWENDNSELDRLRDERRQCKKIVKDVSEFVYNTQDSLLRRAIAIKYIEGDTAPNWAKVAVKIGGGNTANGIRMKVARFLNKK